MISLHVGSMKDVGEKLKGTVQFEERERVSAGLRHDALNHGLVQARR